MLTVDQNLWTITDHWIFRGVALLYNSRALEALPPLPFYKGCKPFSFNLWCGCSTSDKTTTISHNFVGYFPPTFDIIYGVVV